MAIIIDTPTIHKSLAQLVLSITPNAYVYDNPNQQGTHLPAWFIVHREPVDIKEDLHGRWWLNYHIDLFYMLDFNGPHLFDDYSAIADRWGGLGEYLPIYGHENVVIHAFERSWGMYMDALKCSMTFKIRVTRDSTPHVYMEVIEDLRVFLKGLKPEFYTLSFTNTEHPDFTVELPDDIVVSANAFVKLPSVSGKHTEDEETWVPSRWDIGEFGSSVEMDEDKVANLLWEELQQYVVSFANTTYPQFDVDLPEQVVVIAGESITLPSVSVQFVEDGYVYTPSGWDIGDFGSEFTPTGNTIANLIFNAEKQYEEITLYMQSGNKNVQTNVTSAFTDDVNSTYCYRLYTDEECTILWKGYDYSNDYKVGYIPSSGVWTEFIDSIAEMPDYVGSGTDFKVGRILLDTGFLWVCCNLSSGSSATTSTSKIVVRIYPKAQQHYAVYLKYNDAYRNQGFTRVEMGTYPWPTGEASSNQKAWYGAFPKITITKLLMAAGNEAQLLSGDMLITSSSYRMLFKQASSTLRSFRAIEYTLDRPTLHAWLNPNHINVSTLSVQLYDLYDDAGNKIMFDGDVSTVYVPIGIFLGSGASCLNEFDTLQKSKFGHRSTGEWCFIQSYSSVSIARVWYVKYTDCKVAYFKSDKSNYALQSGTTRTLYDANGVQIPYDPTKTYTIIQLRESSTLVVTPTFDDLARKTLVNSSGNLACKAASGGTYQNLTVASVWYLEE